uniref:Uncharacterized protein n=1 Tax=Nelumbo nucifera TaxID=4432 RepID=A0A822ZQB8_NELNU|nr:TPA_asm: hypothetical protein HUJ06_003941 [Nelumbo nucifera]
MVSRQSTTYLYFYDTSKGLFCQVSTLNTIIGCCDQSTTLSSINCRSQVILCKWCILLKEEGK